MDSQNKEFVGLLCRNISLATLVRSTHVGLLGRKMIQISRYRDDYKFSEMIGQKPLIATLVPNLIGHPYIT